MASFPTPIRSSMPTLRPTTTTSVSGLLLSAPSPIPPATQQRRLKKPPHHPQHRRMLQHQLQPQLLTRRSANAVDLASANPRPPQKASVSANANRTMRSNASIVRGLTLSLSALGRLSQCCRSHGTVRGMLASLARPRSWQLRLSTCRGLRRRVIGSERRMTCLGPAGGEGMSWRDEERKFDCLTGYQSEFGVT